MIVPDLNLLLYAVHQPSPQFARASIWLHNLMNGDEPVGMPWAVSIGFIRLITNPRIFSSPLSVEHALAVVDGWQSQRIVASIVPGPQHWQVLQSLLIESGTAGNLTTDAHLAALCIEGPLCIRPTPISGDSGDFAGTIRFERRIKSELRFADFPQVMPAHRSRVAYLLCATRPIPYVPHVSRIRSIPRLHLNSFQRQLAVLAVLLTAADVSGCASAPKPAPSVAMASGAGVVSGSAESNAAIARAEEAATQFAPADVEFMQGMIPHHAQAVIMGRWCATHGQRADLKVLCERIVVAQGDEIRLMRRWLAERNQDVPDSMATKHVMKMGNMVHETMMPGMLTDEQMAELDKARGSEFDRLFLIGMIGHHEGALSMVRELFSHGNAGHDDTVFKFATDVEADQSAELHKMRLMLESLKK